MEEGDVCSDPEQTTKKAFVLFLCFESVREVCSQIGHDADVVVLLLLFALRVFGKRRATDFRLVLC